MVRMGYQRVCFARLHQLHQSPWQTYFTFQSNLALCLWNGNLLTSFQFIKRLKRSRQELSSYPSYKSACKDPGKTHIQSHFWFIEWNNLLSGHQYGFRPGYFCTSQVIHLFYEWAKALDKRLSTDVIFLDCEKAFDSVPRDRLLPKLEHSGITGSLLSCLSNFHPYRSRALSYLVFHREAFLPPCYSSCMSMTSLNFYQVLHTCLLMIC